MLSRVSVGAVVLSALLGPAGSAQAHQLVDTPMAPGAVAVPLPSGAVARVGTTLVRRRTYLHWYRAAAGRRRPRAGSRRHLRLRREAMQFLIEMAWIRLETREHGITVSRSALLRQFRENKRDAFDSEREYRRYLRGGTLSEKDLLFRTMGDMLQGRLTRHVVAPGGDDLEQQQALDRYAAAFRRKWTARTACARRYRIRDCSREATMTASSWSIFP